MKSTANRIRPKVTNAGMIGLVECCKYRSRAGERLWPLSAVFSNAQIDSATPFPPDLSEQAWLLAAGALLGFDRGDRGHVENTARGHRGSENVRGARGAD